MKTIALAFVLAAGLAGCAQPMGPVVTASGATQKQVETCQVFRSMRATPGGEKEEACKKHLGELCQKCLDTGL